MSGKLDADLNQIMSFLINELDELQKQPVQSMLLQAVAMAFAYNAHLVFQCLENQNMLVKVFE